MAYDFRANQVRLNRIISSGSIPILIYPSGSALDLAGNLATSFSTASIGTDVFLYVSGSSTAKTLFGGDVVVSGSLIGSIISGSQLSGSLQTIATNTPYLLAGTNISIATSSIGQVTISSNVTSSTNNDFFYSTTPSIIQTSGSLYLSGNLQSLSLSSSNGGTITGSFIHGLAGNIGVGINSHAEGAYVQTHGSYSHAEGFGNQTYGIGSHAEGYGTAAISDESHAEGVNTSTNGYYSHAEGSSTKTYGIGSHAEGSGSIAYGTGSHAGGLYTIASGSVDGTDPPLIVQTVFGKYNKRNNTDSLFVIGNGSGDSDASRNDIFRINSGSIEVTGSFRSTEITGSISGTIGGLPFISGGTNITASYNSSGQWEISSIAGGSVVPAGLDQQVQFNSGSTFSGSSNLTYNYTTNNLTITGSLISNVITSSLLRVNNIDITPITSSLIVYGDNINFGSGSISNLFNDVGSGNIGKYEIEILAISSSNAVGASWKFSTTCIWPNGGIFSFLGATELSTENSAESAMWDVNFNVDTLNNTGKLELTGSSGSVGTLFYIQVTKKMICNFGGIIF